MPHSKKDRLFPARPALIADAKLARMIAAALHQDYGDMPSPVKHLGLQTGINLRAIKNWFQAHHAPSSRHLLALAGVSPSVLRLILECTGEAEKNFAADVPLNVPIKPAPANHNKRQAWFLRSLRRGLKTTARNIQMNYGVTLKTARRDIAGLKKQGLIRFIGARKTGYYSLV